jgi:autotransporter-associated beta strand protein
MPPLYKIPSRTDILVTTAALALGMILFTTPRVHAQTWDGGGTDNYWNTANNWSPDGVPATGGTLQFTGSARMTNINNLVDYTAGTGSNALGFNNANPYHLSGNALKLNGNIFFGGAALTSLVTHEVALDLVLQKAITVSTSSTGFGNLKISGAISGGFAILKSVVGDLELTGSNSFSGNLTVGAGSVTISSLADSGANSAAGAGSLIQIGAGTADGSLIYTGAAASTNRQIQIGQASATVSHTGAGSLLNNGSGELTFTNATFNPNVTQSAASRTLTLGGSGNLTIQGVVKNNTSNSINLVKTGAGRLTLAGSNTYTGGTAINAGTLRVGHANALGATGNIALGGGTLQYGSGITADLSSRIKNSASSVNIDTNGETVTFASAVDSTNSGGLAKLGAGTLILSANASYTGGTTITAGTLQIGNGGTAGSLGTGTVTNNSHLAINRSDAHTISNTINGTGNLSVTGGGVITLGASNNYTGATTVQSGSLAVGGSIASSSLTTVNSGGFLLGSGTVGDLVIASGGTINPGNSPGTITVGNTTWNGGGNYNWQLYDATSSAGTGWDLISSTGTLTIGATSGDKFNINLWSLSGISPDANGAPINFTASSNYSWNIASFSSISGFSQDKFQIVSTASNGTGGFSGFTGTFALSSNGTTLTLNYTAPSSTAIWTEGSGNWSTGGNWQSGSVPSEGTPLEFVGAGGTSTNNSALSSVGGMTFGANATGSYTVNGTALQIATAGIRNNSTYAQTVATDFTLTVALSFSASAGNLTISGSVDNNGHLLTTTGNHTLHIQGPISGSAGLIQEVNGTLILSGNNTYNGTTTISAGTLQIGTGGTSGALSATSTITNNGTLVFNRSDTITQGTSFSASAIGGSGALVQKGAGTLVLNTANSYTAGTTLQAGTLRVDHANALGTTGNITFTGGTVQYGSGITADLSPRIKNSTGAMAIDTNGQSITFSSALDSTNSGGLAKSGNGTLTLVVANSYTGGTAINGGTIEIRNASALGTSGTISFGGGTLLWGNVTTDLSSRLSTAGGQDFKFDVGANTVTFNTAISNAGGTLTKNGSGTLRLFGASALSSIIINSGTLRAGNNANTFGGAGGTIVMNGGSLYLYSNTSGSGNYSNNDLLIQGDAKILNATPSNIAATYYLFGNLTIGASTLTIDPIDPGGATDGTIRITKNTTLTGDATFNITDRGNNVLVLQDIIESGGSRSLTKAGAGTLTINGSAIHTGATTINAGTLEIGSAGRLGGGTYLGAIANSGSFIYSGTNNQTLSGVISGTGALTQNASSTLTLSNANTYTGTTTINTGTLTVSGGSAIADAGAVSVASGAVFNLGASETIGSIAGAGNVTLGANTLTTGSNNSSTTLSGVISGASGALTKSGTGTLTLTGNNTYTGATTVNAGTLQAAATGALGNSTVINVTGGSFLVTAANAVNDNAAVNLGGGKFALSGAFDETVGLLTLSANSTIDFSGFGGTLRFGGIGSWSPGATLAIWNWSGTTQYGTQINNYANPSNLVFTNNSILTSNLANISFYSDSGNSFVGSGFEVSGFSGGGSQIIAVPETETYLTGFLLILGFGIYQLRLSRQGRGLLARFTFLLPRAYRKSLQNHHSEFAILAAARQRDLLPG